MLRCDVMPLFLRRHLNLQRRGQAVPEWPAMSDEPIVHEDNRRQLPLRNGVLPSLFDLLIVRREVEHLVYTFGNESGPVAVPGLIS